MKFLISNNTQITSVCQDKGNQFNELLKLYFTIYKYVTLDSKLNYNYIFFQYLNGFVNKIQTLCKNRIRGKKIGTTTTTTTTTTTATTTIATKNPITITTTYITRKGSKGGCRGGGERGEGRSIGKRYTYRSKRL